MTLPFAVSVALIALCCALFAKPEPPQPAGKNEQQRGGGKGEMKERMQEERSLGKRSAVKEQGIRATEEGGGKAGSGNTGNGKFGLWTRAGSR